MRYLKHFLILAVLSYSTFLSGEITRRAAFDFGSGKIKLQVADVDTESHKIVNSIYSEEIFVLLSDDAGRQPDGSFSDAIINKALEGTNNLKQKAIAMGAQEFRGLATEAYRKAPNGQCLVDRYLTELNIPVTIISQSEEGELGFFSLIAERNLNPLQVVSWDIGGGSFQITYLDDENNCHVYMAPFGRVTAKNAIIKNIKLEDPQSTLSPNPMSRKEWEDAVRYFNRVLPKIPPALSQKLKTKDVQLMGISAHPEKLRNLGTYTINDIKKIVENCLDKCDAELAKNYKTPPMVLTDLSLVYSVMQKIQVTDVVYQNTLSGSTSALLISEKYWNCPDIELAA